MKNLPWKKIGKGALKVLGVASALDPRLAVLAPVVELVEKLMPNAPGADKKAAVLEALEAYIQMLPEAKQAQARELYALLNDLYVQARNLETKIEDTVEAIKALKDGD